MPVGSFLAPWDCTAGTHSSYLHLWQQLCFLILLQHFGCSADHRHSARKRQENEEVHPTTSLWPLAVAVRAVPCVAQPRHNPPLVVEVLVDHRHVHSNSWAVERDSVSRRLPAPALPPSVLNHTDHGRLRGESVDSHPDTSR